ncbi:MAG: hypothetical protein M1824_002596 [Vezdaea acicularis]|nr:MAG: hypothetical protein M1824_002596 [Vezdaea acicularis]
MKKKQYHYLSVLRAGQLHLHIPLSGENSRLLVSLDKIFLGDNGGLSQDRYALRTSSQWMGPQLEDLMLAHKQIIVELNSTTDNPILDVAGKIVHHGGNFQAMSVTSAMEKTRLTMQLVGNIVFAHCTELTNASLNNGLPPNLAADELSLSYTMKGVDINMASYMSECAFLANPVGSHVQSAEMSNQAINSLALVSAQYTHSAAELLSLISASYLYVLCQALDLGVMQLRFLDQLERELRLFTPTIFRELASEFLLKDLHSESWKHVTAKLLTTTTIDSFCRF